jgi:hypothetical protein
MHTLYPDGNIEGTTPALGETDYYMAAALVEAADEIDMEVFAKALDVPAQEVSWFFDLTDKRAPYHAFAKLLPARLSAAAALRTIDVCTLAVKYDLPLAEVVEGLESEAVYYRETREEVRKHLDRAIHA